MKYIRFTLPVLLFIFTTGFDFAKHSIPIDEILSGGPPKDGIPALSDPEFVTADEAGFLSDDDMVIGLVVKGEVKAYPVKILNWHEAVNDTVGGRKILTTW